MNFEDDKLHFHFSDSQVISMVVSLAGKDNRSKVYLEDVALSVKSLV
jgi:hypothetical protein